jgi:predicted phage terminase large subunit-like protein
MMKPELVRFGAECELARRDFYDYCRLLYPKFYKPDRKYLKTLARTLQNFVDKSSKHFLIVNLPPRFGKSYTAQNFVEWLLGRDHEFKVMTGSYNEILSTTFSKKVRETISEIKVSDRPVFTDVWPHTTIKHGDAAANLWALDDHKGASYLATSPTGTATGFGANLLLIDDVIKNHVEAYNENVLEGHYDWFKNTMLSRTEGDNWKCIIIMTRWALGDLAGRVLNDYTDEAEILTFKAVQDDGSMLCDSILSRAAYDLKTQEMNPDIVEANYNQQPIDVKGRLINGLMEWDELPDGVVRNITDTADKGADFLASMNFIQKGEDVYVKGAVYTDEAAEISEKLLADSYVEDGVADAQIEANNGGRLFARSVERLLKERGAHVRITTPTQTQNKESRILAASSWIMKHVFMPPGWQKKYPEMAHEILTYQKKGKNAHDDACDVLASIYEAITNDRHVEVMDKSVMGGIGRPMHRNNYWKA